MKRSHSYSVSSLGGDEDEEKEDTFSTSMACEEDTGV